MQATSYESWWDVTISDNVTDMMKDKEKRVSSFLLVDQNSAIVLLCLN
jgi:hypothetical protein